jgi:hypothetical protein
MRDKTRGRNTSYRMRAFAKHLASLYMTRCSDVWRNYHFREQAWKMKLAESPISDITTVGLFKAVWKPQHNIDDLKHRTMFMVYDIRGSTQRVCYMERIIGHITLRTRNIDGPLIHTLCLKQTYEVAGEYVATRDASAIIEQDSAPPSIFRRCSHCDNIANLEVELFIYRRRIIIECFH